jgi:arginine metabolism regulation protein II
LVDAERLLRLRGLAKRELSRRARLLHHVYTWLRIIGESTFTLHDYKNPRIQSKVESSISKEREKYPTVPDKDKTAGRADMNTQLDDFLRVDSNDTDSESDLEALKDQEVGFRDIHLQDTRQWPNTLYMQVYSIPEIWLSLVSQTTRLANVMEFLSHSKEQTPRTFPALLQKKVDRLEHMICTFSVEHSVSRSPSPPQNGQTHHKIASALCSSASQAMLCAMSSALVILFYRRIRRVHPWILQGHINDVISALKDFDLANDERPPKGAGTPWPAFMAGCEAMSSGQREWLMDWMQRGSRQSTSNGFTASQQVMREVWERMDASNKNIEGGYKKAELCTWVYVLRSNNSWLMLY